MRFTLHPLFRLAATQPQLLADHAEAYAELASVQVANAVLAWKRRAVILAVGVTLGIVAVILAGVAAMFWAVTPPGQIHQPLVMIAAPLVPAVAAIVCWLSARGQGLPGMFDEIKDQIRSDMVMLREVSSP